ncbi:MAG: type I phosphomannose isomerase catalytic subunit, partial [Clostridia bacterium]
ALRGSAIGARFPLLLKLIDAREALSVQVHPDDAYASSQEQGKWGKTEAWVILSAQPGAQLVYGITPGTDRDTLAKAAAQGVVLEEYLRHVYVQSGDVLYIPAGMVHAIGKGILLYEIQQSSDVTYRLWDWNRRDAKGNMRVLHLRQALDVARPGLWREALPGVTIPCDGGSRTIYIADRNFALERLTVHGSMPQKPDGSRFYFLTALGSGSLQWTGGTLAFATGDTIFVPATSPAFEIVADCDMLSAYVPDQAQLRALVGPMKAKEVAGLCEGCAFPSTAG